jgi:hypothetical protein
VTAPMTPYATMGVRWYTTGPYAETVGYLPIVKTTTTGVTMRNIFILDLVDDVQPGETLEVFVHIEATDDAKNSGHPSGYAVDFPNCIGLVPADADFDTEVLFNPTGGYDPDYVILSKAAGDNLTPVPYEHHKERYPLCRWTAPDTLPAGLMKVVYTAWADSSAVATPPASTDILTIMANYGGMSVRRETPDAYTLSVTLPDGTVLPVQLTSTLIL